MYAGSLQLIFLLLFSYFLVLLARSTCTKGQGFCRTQTGQLPGWRACLDCPDDSATSRTAVDKYDHLFGLFFNKSGRLRRLFVIHVPQAMLPWAQISWTGSKQYLRFLKKWVSSRGMRLTPYGLMRWV